MKKIVAIPQPVLLVILLLLSLGAPPLRAQGLDRIDQVSDTLRHSSSSLNTSAFSPSLSPDGRFLVFASDADLTGDNPDGTWEVFGRSAGAPAPLVQLTDAQPEQVDPGPTIVSPLPRVSADGRRVMILWEADLLGDNPDLLPVVYLWEEGAIRRISPVDAGTVTVAAMSADGSTVVFDSLADLTGDSPDGGRGLFLWRDGELARIADGLVPDAGVAVSADGRTVAFDVLDRVRQIFLWQDGTVRQISLPTAPPGVPVRSLDPVISGDGRTVAFTSHADLAGDNPDHSLEMFVWRDGAVRQVTAVDDPNGGSLSEFDGHALSADGGVLVFASRRDPLGTNGGQNQQLFHWTGGALSQLTAIEDFDRRLANPVLAEAGQAIAFASTADLTGENPDGSFEIFLARTAPPPPAGPWLVAPELPGFDAKVRIVPAGGEAVTGRPEGDCIPESLCASGALAGRPEVFVKVIGPRPNGFLWAQLSRFTPSAVEIWLRQLATGQVNYYRLGPVGPAADDVPGRQDRRAFSP